MTKASRFVRIGTHDVGVLILENGTYLIVSINLN